MNAHEKLIHDFYTTFQQLDFTTMQSLYHDEACFHDPVFLDLTSAEVRAMWQMLLTSAKDLKVSFSEVKVNAQAGSCRWEAWYTFSKTGRPVHNIIHASFQFKEGKIYRHKDSFDLWRWARQALGISGVLLGWSSLVQNKIRETARHNLKKHMNK